MVLHVVDLSHEETHNTHLIKARYAKAIDEIVLLKNIVESDKDAGEYEFLVSQLNKKAKSSWYSDADFIDLIDYSTSLSNCKKSVKTKICLDISTMQVIFYGDDTNDNAFKVLQELAKSLIELDFKPSSRIEDQKNYFESVKDNSFFRDNFNGTLHLFTESQENRTLDDWLKTRKDTIKENYSIYKLPPKSIQPVSPPKESEGLADESKVAVDEESSESEEDEGYTPDDDDDEQEDLTGKSRVMIPVEQRMIDRADLNAMSDNEILTMITVMDASTKYAGFSPRFMRSEFLRRHNDPNVAAKNLFLSFNAYSRIGNNPSKLGHKRIEMVNSKALATHLTSNGIAIRAKDVDTLTLPRLAIAFMPQYLLFRKFCVSQLQDQTSSKLNVVYKDVAFNGCPLINTMPEYDSFNTEFSSYIYKKGVEVDIKDEKFLKSIERWRKIASKGYAEDKEIHTMMDEAVTRSTGDLRTIYYQIRNDLGSFHVFLTQKDNKSIEESISKKPRQN